MAPPISVEQGFVKGSQFPSATRNLGSNFETASSPVSLEQTTFKDFSLSHLQIEPNSPSFSLHALLSEKGDKLHPLFPIHLECDAEILKESGYRMSTISKHL